MHLVHRRHQALTLRGRQGLEDLLRHPVGAPVGLRDLVLARFREACVTYALVVLAGLHLHEPLRGQRVDQAAQVAGVQLEAVAQVTQLRAFRADLPEQARLAERPVAAEEGGLERSGTFRDDPVEAADRRDLVGIHLSDFSQRLGPGQAPDASSAHARTRGVPRRHTLRSELCWR